MDKNSKLFDIAPDYEECCSRYDEIETYIKNPDEFIAVIKEKSNLIFSDKVIKRVINIYKDVCKLGNSEEVKLAKSTLKKAGIDAFIAKEARAKRSGNMFYRWYKQNPWLLIWQVEYQKTLIQPYLKSTYREKYGVHEKNKDILIAFENIVGFKPNENEAYILTQGERSKDLTHISLSFLSFNPGDPKDVIPFESLKDLYYEISTQHEELKENITENILDFFPFYMDGMIGYFEYINILHG